MRKNGFIICFPLSLNTLHRPNISPLFLKNKHFSIMQMFSATFPEAGTVPLHHSQKELTETFDKRNHEAYI